MNIHLRYGSFVEFAQRIIKKRFFRFLVIGGVNTVISYGIFCLLIWLGLYYQWAGLLSYFLGVIVNFHTTGYFVFKSRDYGRFFWFGGVYVFMYIVYYLELKLLVPLLGAYVSGALVIFPNAVLSFLLNRGIVFKQTF